MAEKFYITTPIYYVNADPHIGHAYTQVAVDAIARYHKMLGEEVFFLTGTDEHGEKIEEASLKAGFKKGREKEFTDTIVNNFKAVWSALGIDYSEFLRTTDPAHKETVQYFLNKMKEKGDIYQGEYDGWFCTPCETFWTDTQSADGMCPDCSRKLERIKEKNYFFRMSNYQQWLLEHINKNPNFIMPDFRKNEVLGFLKEGLNDLCISRPKERMSWGIELPFDTDYVVYVWFDALINYVSGVKKEPGCEKFWPADVHMIAKDILRHHAVFWPIMLKSVGIEIPKTVFAHGWWKMGSEKMSKSRGNVVNPVELIEKYGRDAVRYFLLKAVSLGGDGVFSEDALVTTYNSDLANDLGNLLNRTLTMVEKYFGGISPDIPENCGNPEQQERSAAIKKAVLGLLPGVKECYLSPKLLLKESLEAVMKVIGKANKYIEESAPWEHSKANNMEAIKLIMADLVEVLRVSAIGICPVMPATAQKIWDQLGLTGDLESDISRKELTNVTEMGTVEWRKYPAGTKIKKGEPLFPRIKT